MNPRRNCLVCDGSMELGFPLDQAHNPVRAQQEWWQGNPQRSIWMGLKKPERKYKIIAMRCTKCGFIMEFAQPDESGDE